MPAKIQRAKDGTPVVVGARDYRKSHRFCGARAIGSTAECLK
ncbi:MAG: hypothetical protein WCC00_00690 [Candidatus Aminicenantales bacterium]